MSKRLHMLCHGLTILLLLIGLIPWFFDTRVNLSGYRLLYPWISYGITLLLTLSTYDYFHRYHFSKTAMVLPWLNLILFCIPNSGWINDNVHTLGLIIISTWIIINLVLFDPSQLKILAITLGCAMASMMLTLNINYLAEFFILMAYEYGLVKPLLKTTFHR